MAILPEWVLNGIGFVWIGNGHFVQIQTSKEHIFTLEVGDIFVAE